jgi:hypothetical protein
VIRDRKESVMKNNYPFVEKVIIQNLYENKNASDSVSKTGKGREDNTNCVSE